MDYDRPWTAEIHDGTDNKFKRKYNIPESSTSILCVDSTKPLDTKAAKEAWVASFALASKPDKATPGDKNQTQGVTMVQVSACLR